MPRQRRTKTYGRTPTEDVSQIKTEALPDALQGIVIRAHGLWYEVRTYDPDQRWIATMRGSLKRQSRRTDIVAVGDRVWITAAGDGEAVIEQVAPRTSVFARTARNTRDTEQVVLANPDQVVLVFAAREPEPHLRMLDRFIVLGEMQDLPIRIVVNKMDLEADLPQDGELGPARERFRHHQAIYPVHYTSSQTGEGLEALHQALVGRISVVAGPSGVGKSSLLNALDPERNRDIGLVSEATGKGRHTTVGAHLQEIGTGGTFVADTPGMRSLAMHAIPPEDLDWYFREFRGVLGECRFRGCTHLHEPGCAVRQAVEEGDISAERFDSYALVHTESTGGRR